MWCTRWFLPLLLIPLPTAPPYFLLLFLFSLTLQAKPCFYCIVLLTTLFISSCYWQPFPIDSPLASPWSDNITTFADALNVSLNPQYSRPLPTVMRIADRCWCDFSSGGFFEPFNVSRWEYSSIQALKDELEREQSAKDAPAAVAQPHEQHTDDPSVSMPLTAPPSTKSAGIGATNLWSLLRSLNRQPADPSAEDSLPSEPPKLAEPSISSPPPTPSELLRKEYDLRPYGLGLVIDFGWSR